MGQTPTGGSAPSSYGSSRQLVDLSHMGACHTLLNDQVVAMSTGLDSCSPAVPAGFSRQVYAMWLNGAIL